MIWAWRLSWGLDQQRGRGRMKGRHRDEKRLKTQADATQPTVYEILRKSRYFISTLMSCWKSAMIIDSFQEATQCTLPF
jgi:hypothetical protein